MIILGIGSSIEPKEFYLKEAIQEIKLCKEINVLNVSKVYLTKAWGGIAVNDFLNICVEIEYNGDAKHLLKIIQKIEKDLGRIRKEHWGDRTIDIDILLFNNQNINTDDLIVPHKHITDRNFVLYPIYDLHPELYIKNKHISYWLENVSKEIIIYKEKL